MAFNHNSLISFVKSSVRNNLFIFVSSVFSCLAYQQSIVIHELIWQQAEWSLDHIFIPVNMAKGMNIADGIITVALQLSLR